MSDTLCFLKERLSIREKCHANESRISRPAKASYRGAALQAQLSGVATATHVAKGTEFRELKHHGYLHCVANATYRSWGTDATSYRITVIIVAVADMPANWDSVS